MQLYPGKDGCWAQYQAVIEANERVSKHIDRTKGDSRANPAPPKKNVYKKTRLLKEKKSLCHEGKRKD